MSSGKRGGGRPGGEKPVRWIAEELTTPPVGRVARYEAGLLLRRLQRGESIGMPESRPMPSIGGRVHELRVKDLESRATWRMVYRIDPDAILVVHWWKKKTERTAKRDLDLSRRRLQRYDREE